MTRAGWFGKPNPKEEKPKQDQSAPDVDKSEEAGVGTRFPNLRVTLCNAAFGICCGITLSVVIYCFPILVHGSISMAVVGVFQLLLIYWAHRETAKSAHNQSTCHNWYASIALAVFTLGQCYCVYKESEKIPDCIFNAFPNVHISVIALWSVVMNLWCVALPYWLRCKCGYHQGIPRVFVIYNGEKTAFKCLETINEKKLRARFPSWQESGPLYLTQTKIDADTKKKEFKSYVIDGVNTSSFMDGYFTLMTAEQLLGHQQQVSEFSRNEEPEIIKYSVFPKHFEH